MKNELLGVLAVAGIALAGTRPLQDPAPDDTATLRAEVESQRAEVTRLEGELDAVGKRLDATEAYLRGRSDAASALMKSFTAAEAEGFTAGINYRSREILLEGFRTYMSGAQKAVPGKPAEDDEDPKKKNKGR